VNDFRAIGRRARDIARLTGQSFWKGFQSFYDSDNLTYAASIAYYALLSLFPFLLIVISILGSVTADDATRQKVLQFVLLYFPAQFDFIIAQLDAFRQTPIRLGIGGGIALVWAALGVFGAISTAVNHAWGVEKTRSFWRHRWFSFLMLVAAGLILLAALLGAMIVQIVDARWFSHVSVSYPAIMVFRSYTIQYGLLLVPSFVLGLVYFFVPNVKVMVKDVWLGALITGLLWNAGFKGFSWFVRDPARFSRIHGSVAAIVVFLMWVYVSAIILLWGVEFTASYGNLRTHRRARALRPDA
jgi:membrane protein